MQSMLTLVDTVVLRYSFDRLGLVDSQMIADERIRVDVSTSIFNALRSSRAFSSPSVWLQRHRLNLAEVDARWRLGR